MLRHKLSAPTVRGRCPNTRLNSDYIYGFAVLKVHFANLHLAGSAISRQIACTFICTLGTSGPHISCKPTYLTHFKTRMYSTSILSVSNFSQMQKYEWCIPYFRTSRFLRLSLNFQSGLVNSAKNSY